MPDSRSTLFVPRHPSPVERMPRQALPGQDDMADTDSGSGPGELPGVSYVMPVLNEAAYLEDAVQSILRQNYRGPSEVILALGPSTDGTSQLVQRLIARESRIRTVENPGTDIPIGLNRAIRASRYPVIVRVDAHTEIDPDYTGTAVATLLRTGAASLGGIMAARGRTVFQRAVARAYNSRFGLGGGAYHGAGTEGPAESAYMGVMRKESLLSVGLFDESLRRGEDWELNLRLRNAGHLVWLDPRLLVVYWPRSTPGRLARQFLSTGIWRGELVRRLGGRNPLRFFVPPALVLSFAASVGVAGLQLGGLLTGFPAAIVSVVYLGPSLYVLALLAIGGSRTGGRGLADRASTILALGIMHLSWGAGFLLGLSRGARDATDTSRTES